MDIYILLLVSFLSLCLGFLSGMIWKDIKFKKNLKKLVGARYVGKDWGDIKKKD